MNKKEVKLKINDNELKGVYANQVAVLHSKYDFVIDFISMFPPEAVVNTRVITNPAAFKQMYQAIGANIKKYEEKFGPIETIGEDSGFPGQVN